LKVLFGAEDSQKSFFNLLNKGAFQEKNGKPEALAGFLKISSFLHTKSVNFGKGLPYFFFPQRRCLTV